MKKISSFLVALMLISGFFAANISSTTAYSEWEGDRGQGCQPGYLYSPLTGIRCSVQVKANFPPGCSSSYGYSYLTGVRCDPYPMPELPTQISPITISGVSGPQKLKVNQKGTWRVRAYDEEGRNLSYSVKWGDEYYKMGASGAIAADERQSATFTHTYKNAGVYNPTFYVSNDYGSESANLSVTVGNDVLPDSAKLTIITPNGGETFRAGDSMKISWKSENYPVNTPVTLTLSTRTGNGYSEPFVYSVAFKISSSALGKSFTWKIPADLPSNNYWVHVGCRKNWNFLQNCYGDESDSSFVINSAYTQPSITVLSPNGGEVLTRGASLGTGDLLWFETKYYSQKEGKICEYITGSNNINNWANKKYYHAGCSSGFSASENGTTTRGSMQINSSFDAGKYYFLSIWHNQDGTGEAYDFSDRPFKIVLPYSSKLSATCTATDIVDDIIMWRAQVFGGSSPYKYAWSAYNDVAAYTAGSTTSPSFAASYSSPGTKEAVIRVTDSSGDTISASCSGSVLP